MKRVILCLLLSVFCMTSYASESDYKLTPELNFRSKPSIEWEATFRTSAIMSSLMDTYQTNRWMDRPGTYEQNPLMAPFVKPGNQAVFTTVALGATYLLDRGVQSIRDKSTRTFIYLLWYGFSTAAVLNNQRRFNVGFPVVWIQVRF